MQTITDIVITKNKKAQVFLDGQVYCVLEMITYVKSGLSIGQQISQADIDAVFDESQKVAAFEKSINYVSSGMRTKHQVKKYLAGKGFAANVIDGVVNKLEEYKYVDDAQYAKSYAQLKSSDSGKIKIKYDLINKGIDKQNIENAVSTVENQEQVCCKVAEKYMRNKTATTENKAKLYRHLAARGFDYQTIKTALRQCFDSCDEEI